MTLFQFLERFQRMDPRFVFLGMAVAIVVPMFVPIQLGFKIDERVQALYDQVEAVPDGSTVLLSADFDPGSRPELEPFMRANLHHLFRKDVKVVMVTLWETAPPLVGPMLEEVAGAYDLEYGTDYAFLGFKPGLELAIKAIGANIPKSFPVDPKGNPVESLPIMQGKRQAQDFPLLVLISAGFPGTREYVLQIQGQYSLDMVSACTAVSAPDYVPFYKGNQLRGLVGGMPAAAQYERLVWPDGPPEGVRLLATPAVNVLNLGHLYIIVLIMLGNIAWFLTRPRGGPAAGGRA
ncbi:MAG: hypothetical protein AAGA48_19960 [Myxococcota bacterium]